MPVVPWVTSADLPAERPALPGGDEEWDALGALATSVLFTLSGGRWAGARTRVVDVVAVGARRWELLYRGHTDWWWDGSWGACLDRGEVYNHTGCHRPRRVRLPHYPVRSVSEVRTGDTVRDPATYRLNEGRWLEDLTPHGGWPTCNPGITVTYVAGTDPPPEAADAARALALQLGYARAGDPRCRLPRNVTSITRQGTTTKLVPAADLIAQGRTGLEEVDVWLGVANPANRRHRPSSWSPDTDPRTYVHPEETP